jgi:hypothetical protein
MTVRTGICVLVMAASAAWAQNPPMSAVNDTRRLVNGISKPTEQKRVNAGNGVGVSVRQDRANSKGLGKPEKTVAKARIIKTVKAKAAIAPRGVSKTSETDKASETSGDGSVAGTIHGRRDPFMTVIRSQSVEGGGCGAGKKCLQVEKIDLKGIVSCQNGMIAVVENQQRKTYFLHENDPIFKGHVVKINSDSVVFQQDVVDRVGHRSTKDVVKRLSGPAV